MYGEITPETYSLGVFLSTALVMLMINLNEIALRGKSVEAIDYLDWFVVSFYISWIWFVSVPCYIAFTVITGIRWVRNDFQPLSSKSSTN